jgi:hypothetical protein
VTAFTQLRSLRIIAGLAKPKLSAAERRLVGPGRVERPTSRLSGVRSNHLSYEPKRGVRLRVRRPHPIRGNIPRKTLAGLDGKEGKRRGRLSRHCRKSETDQKSERLCRLFAPFVLSPEIETRSYELASDFRIQKGGDPAAGSPTATLLRLRPSR